MVQSQKSVSLNSGTNADNFTWFSTTDMTAVLYPAVYLYRWSSVKINAL